MLTVELLQTTELINVLLDYLTGGRSSREMEAWLLEHLQDILNARDETAIKIANQVDALLVEKSEGLLTEDQMKRSLADLIHAEHPLTHEAFNALHTVIHRAERDLSSFLVIRVNREFASAGAGTRP